MPVPDTDITEWYADYLGADLNTPRDSQLIAGQLDDEVRNIKSVGRAEAENKQWVRPGLTPTYISATSFSFTGDQRTLAPAGRRLKASLTGSTKYGYVLSSSYGSGITTITCQWDLEEYTAQAWTRTNANTITFAGVNVAASFPSTLRVEFWDDDASSPEVTMRVVDAAAFSTNTTVSFLTGDPYHDVSSGVNRLMVPSAGIDNTVVEVQFGALTPDLYQSGWGHTAVGGSFQIAANNTTGPFTIALPDRRPNNTYVVQIQATGANTTPSNTVWVEPMVTARTVSNFAVTFKGSINTGPVLTYDFSVLEQS